MSDNPDKTKWQALMRGQVISSTGLKFSRLVQLVDQKAQVMILLNSILIPVCIRGFYDPVYHWPAIISIVTSCISILSAIICIYPKRKMRKPGTLEMNYLHFNDIGHMKRDDFMSQFMPMFNDSEKLAELAVKDLHDIARNSLIPKYVWIKLSYGVFFFGNIIAIATMTVLF
ncbi:MAG: hypothetical protein KTR28_02935 [Micavibrio sp.]|nr:hypothetical protein [Micavibrio sp.]